MDHIFEMIYILAAIIDMLVGVSVIVIIWLVITLLSLIYNKWRQYD